MTAVKSRNLKVIDHDNFEKDFGKKSAFLSNIPTDVESLTTPCNDRRKSNRTAAPWINETLLEAKAEMRAEKNRGKPNQKCFVKSLENAELVQIRETKRQREQLLWLPAAFFFTFLMTMTGTAKREQFSRTSKIYGTVRVPEKCITFFCPKKSVFWHHHSHMNVTTQPFRVKTCFTRNI